MKYSIHRRGQTARQMNTQQYIDWDQRRAALCRHVGSAEWVDSALRLHRAHNPVSGLTSASVVEQVTKNIERLAGSEAGQEYWTIY